MTTNPSPGLLRRLAALSYDTLLLIGIMMLITAVILPLNGGNAFEPGNWYYRAALLGVLGCFYCGFWYRGGQTLGMRVWRLKLVSKDHRPISLGGCLARLGFAVISLASLGLGIFWVIFDRENRSWHGRWSGTQLIVVPA